MENLASIWQQSLPHERTFKFRVRSERQRIIIVHLLIDLSGKNPEEQKRDDTLMDTVDRINRSFGKDTLVFGSQGTEQKWRGASDHCSPNYTLDIAGFPVVKAK